MAAAVASGMSKQPCITWQPRVQYSPTWLIGSVVSSRVTSAAGTVEPPAQMARTDDRSVSAKRGCSSIAINIVGTPTMALPR